LLIVRQAFQPGGVPPCRSVNSALVSFHLWSKPRRSTGRRVRMTGWPVARVAR
jgi:hypothetical protein